MLTKSDLKSIKNIIDPLEKDIKSVKKDVSTLKTDVSILKGDVSVLKKDVKDIKQDTLDIKLKINEFAKSTLDMFGDLLDWTNDIHRDIVKEKLPERVKKLEQIIKTS